MKVERLLKILIFLFVLFLIMPFIKFFVFHILGWHHFGCCHCGRF